LLLKFLFNLLFNLLLKFLLKFIKYTTIRANIINNNGNDIIREFIINLVKKNTNLYLL